MRVPLVAFLSRGDFDAVNALAREVADRKRYDAAVAQDKRQRVTIRRAAVVVAITSKGAR